MYYIIDKGLKDLMTVTYYDFASFDTEIQAEQYLKRIGKEKFYSVVHMDKIINMAHGYYYKKSDKVIH